MKIILCGNEANFKTTIAIKLSERLGYPIVKGSSFELATSTNSEMYDKMGKMLTLDNAIIDRYIYCNKVYASIFPQYTILTTRQFNFIERQIERDEDGETVVVYLHAPVEVLKKRLMKRGDEHMDKVLERLEVINDEYEHVFENSIVKPIRINTEEYGSDEIVKYLLKKYINKEV